MKDQLLDIFRSQFIKYLEQKQQARTTFQYFHLNELVALNEDEAKEFISGLYKDEFLRDKLNQIPTVLSMNKKFIQKRNAKKFANNIDLPEEEDAEIFELIKNTETNQLKDFIVLPIYTPQILEQIQLTTYTQLFRFSRNNYDRLNEVQKYKVLQYVDQINEKYTKPVHVKPTIAAKYHGLKDLIAIRASKLYNHKDNMKAFETEPVQSFLYYLFDHQNQLNTIAENFGKRPRSIESLLEVTSNPDSLPEKKMKKD